VQTAQKRPQNSRAVQGSARLDYVRYSRGRGGWGFEHSGRVLRLCGDSGDEAVRGGWGQAGVADL
jgi:hypothetical protein